MREVLQAVGDYQATAFVVWLFGVVTALLVSRIAVDAAKEIIVARGARDAAVRQVHEAPDTRARP
jgi:hypothetical protein